MLLSAEDIYRSLAELLLQESNLKFARLMVETLNTILLTTSELFELRNRLRNLSTQVISSPQSNKISINNCITQEIMFHYLIFIFIYRKVASYSQACIERGVIVQSQLLHYVY